MSESSNRFFNQHQKIKNAKNSLHKNFNSTKRHYLGNKNEINDMDDYFKYESEYKNRYDKPKKEIYKSNENKKTFISYKNLKELKNKNDGELIMFFQKYDDISQVFRNTKFSDDMVYLMVDILTRISYSNSSPASIILNQIVENTTFIEKEIKLRLNDININNSNYLNFVLNLLNLSDKILDKFSKNNKRIKPGDLLELEDVLNYQIDKKEEKIEEQKEEKNQNKEEKNENYLLIEKILEKIKQFKEKERHINILKLKEKEESLGKKDIKNSDKIPIDYKTANILITKEEFNKNYFKMICPHIKIGSYFSYERYLNTNFYLEREDCYRNLRAVISELQSNRKSINEMNYKEAKDLTKKFSDLYFYINGEIYYLEVNSNGFIITLDFQGINKKKIKFTKRMIAGSLVILTDKYYSDYLLTTVFYNPYFDLKTKDNEETKNKNLKIAIPDPPYYRVQLSLVNINAQSFKFLLNNLKCLQIFESKAYFESKIHIMKRLQQINSKDLPFKDELIDANFSNIKITHPENGYKYNNSIINPDKNEYPDEIKNLFDESQFNALKMTLNNKISLIQGPPGTGKTHFGAIITDILLQNLNKENKNEDRDNLIINYIFNNNINNDNNNPPQILVVCYTNHALDQFIEKVSNYTNDIVRIGGRCQNENVQKYELRNKHINYSLSHHNLVKRLNFIGKNMQSTTALIDKRKRLDPSIVQEEYSELYNKIINDFLYKVKNSLPYYYRKRLYINDKIKKYIYAFWNMIENKNNLLDEIINKLLDILEVKEEKDRTYYFNKIKNAFIGYDKDNEKILDYIYNENRNRINDNNINNNDINGNEEEEDDNDEDEILENEDKLKYRDNIENNEEEENQELLDENDTGFREFSILNQEKYEYLMNWRNYINFFDLGPKIIKIINDYMKQELLKEKLDYIYDFSEFNNVLEKKNQIALLDEAEAIKKYKIVAMTTTGCAKYSTILEQRNFEVIIIEEAAEVLESHVVSSLTKNTKRLILIGDHKQLKPKPYNYDISTKFNFNVSLFERLINNKIPFSALKYQRRMKPIFADFVRIIYGGEDYIDYEDVKNKENVKGMTNDIYFIKHNKEESENVGLKSKQNIYEAKYITKLCNYLILQNYKPENITILTFYIGQVLLIRKYLKENEIKNVRVTSVDNYQGEENDIIILSLVRSNKNAEIGFLSSFNRVCVAFSRAKIGMYIIGNIDCIVESESKLYEKLKTKNINLDEKMIGVWAKIKQKAEEMKIIGEKITLKCQNHNKTTIISKIEDFDNCPEGGCQEPCKTRRKCGHVCEKLCHNYDCNTKKCLKPCSKKYDPCNHPCPKLCYEDCDKCEKIVKKKLPCGHIKDNCKCFEKEDEIKCEEKCERKLKCGHKCELKCYQKCDDHLCKVKVKRKLLCGHEVKAECGKYIYEIICKEKCGEILECGHNCTGTCGECLQGSLHIKCQSKCGKVLPCGHICEQKCSNECLCEKYCENKCPHGYCKDYCLEPCVDCEEKCDIGCMHRRCKKKCGELCDRKPCNLRCNKKMKCGHQCYGLCGEECPNVCRICTPEKECFTYDYFYMSELDESDLVYKTECGHIFSVNGLDAYFKSKEDTYKMIKCPICTKNLIWEPRYQNYIRKVFDAIQQVKKKYIEKNEISDDKNKETFYAKSKKIVNRILDQFDEEDKEKKYYYKSEQKINIFELYNERNYFNKIEYENDNLEKKINIIYNLCKNDFRHKNNYNIKKVTSYNLLTLAEKFMGIEYYAYIIKSEKKEEEELLFLNNFNIIKNYFVFDGQFTKLFFMNLKKKINNMLYYSILKLTSNDKKSINNLYLMMNEGEQELENEKEKNIKLIEEIKKNNFLLDINLKDIFENLEFELKEYEVIRSLGTTVYKCPNGHIYLIGECGRPMEESKCPDCGAKIGGREHIPVRNNTQVNVDNIRKNNLNINNDILNQDDEAYENMNNNDEHHMDPEVEEAIRNNPEMSEYYN